jgi:iron(III) transport system permease protein
MAVISIARPRAHRLPPVVAGAALLVTAGMLLPIAYLVLRTAGAGDAFWETIGRPRTLDIIIRTCLLAAAVAGAAITLSLPLAWLTTRTDLPLRDVWSVLLVLPLVFPSYVGAFAFVAALGPRGMLQALLAPLGVERLPEIYGFAGAWLVLTLFTYPYVLLPVRAVMQRLDRSIEEAARSLGKGALTVFLRVTVPQLRPALAAGGLLVALYTLSDFGVVSILRFDSLTRVIFVQYKSAFDRSGAASLALVLVAIGMLFVLLESVTRGRARYYGRGSGLPRTVALGRWKWPALLFCGLIAALSLALPAGVIAYWLARGLAAGQSVDFVRPAVWNSVYASGLAAAAAVAAALPVALLSVRHPGVLSRLIEKITYSGFALPGITIALALVFFAANYTPFLYQSLGLLVFAYVVRFLPQAVGACRSTLLQVNPNTEEAARGLGHNGFNVFRRVTLPQLLPGISAGGMLVFLTAMKELPATLLLSPLGFSTLATQIWSSTTEAMFARAALPALVLVAISALPMTLIILRERRSQ